MITRRHILSGMSAAALLPRMALGAEKRVFKASIALDQDRVLVAVGMQGKGPYIFMIDTGGFISLIRNSLAKTLKLEMTGHVEARGAGGSDTYPIFMARDFVIGGTMRQPKVALMGAGDLNYGEDIEGTLAAGIMTVVDSDLDFDAGEFRMYPEGRGERPGFAAVASDIRRDDDQSSPFLYVDLAVNGRRLETMLDTGMGELLSIAPSAAKATGLWDDSRPYAPFRPRGIGGQGQLNRIVRAAPISLGGVTFDRPLVALRGQGTGIKAGAEIGDAIAGLALIRRFNLSVDARAGKLWVQPSKQKPPVQDYGYSGLWCDLSGPTTVEAVGTGSPAAAAGIRRGDRIIGEWGKVRTMLGGDAGEVVHLTTERDGMRRDVEFTLKPFLD